MEDFENILNEAHLDTILTKPFDLNKDVKMYHYSDHKITGEMIPIAINMGNKLSPNPRKSIWWTRSPDNFEFIIFNYIRSNFKDIFGHKVVPYFSGIIPEVGYKKTYMYFDKNFYNDNKKEFDSLNAYRYEKTFKYKELGRGTEYAVDEFTYDKPCTPDGYVMKTFKDMISDGTIKLVNNIEKYEEDFQKLKQTGHWNDWIGRKKEWYKYDFDDYHARRKEYEAKNNIQSYKEIHMKDFKINEEYDTLDERLEVLLTRPKDFINLIENNQINTNETQVKTLTENVIEEQIDNLLESAHSTLIKYGKYLTEHIANVKKGYFWIKDHCPEMLEKCNKKQVEENLIVHDESKYSNEEWKPYAEFFYGRRTPEVEKDFEKAKSHHYANNPHHHEWWRGKPMKEDYIIEMICDWWSFSWKTNNLRDIFDYFENTVMSEKAKGINLVTLKRVKELLTMLKEALLRENLI